MKLLLLALLISLALLALAAYGRGYALAAYGRGYQQPCNDPRCSLCNRQP